ncbi:MAG: hypothetical protein WBD56_08905 [Anaerolineales bacterium]
MNDLHHWLLKSDEPWTRYRTMIDLLGIPPDDPDVGAVRSTMLAHPKIKELIAEASTWPGYSIKRHNDAKHPIYKFSTLADFGLRADDPGMSDAVESLLAHQSPEGAFQIQINIPKAFGGTGEDAWSWVLCDAPTSLYSLLAMRLGSDPHVQNALEHLASLVEENGYRCKASPDLGKFRGPGKKADPCPIANVYALKALSLAVEYLDSTATRAGSEVLLNHWEHRGEYKLYLFGIGTDFRKLKYPYVWYDILHVTEVLSRFPFLREDPRLKEMVSEITLQADEEGRYTPNSMYRAWKGWSFADKKNPSPWLTFLVLRILMRLQD